MVDTNQWHAREQSDILQTFDSDRTRGLDEAAVTESRAKHGANKITEKKQKLPIVLFLEQFNQPLIYILLAASAGTAFLQEWVDCLVILAVVIINAVTGFIQEAKAIKAIKALSQSMVSLSNVLRNGAKQQLPAEELVPGDIVLLQSGDKVPADLRLIETKNLQIDESALTGESVPVEKDASNTLDPNTALADRENMTYSSTLVTYGASTGLVVETGDTTEIGKINQMIGEADVLKTPLTQKIHQLSLWLLWIIIGLAILTFVAGFVEGRPINKIFLEAVALAVGAVPEGLPAVITITLALGVGKLAAQNSIIRKLPAVETLGGTTVICSDKTGTLTQNQMTVQQIYAGKKTVSITGVGYAPLGHFEVDGTQVSIESVPLVKEVLTNGLLCNDSNLKEGEDGWMVVGDPTEGALISSALKAQLDRTAIEQELPRLDTIPFESEYKYMATLHRMKDNNRIYIKGSTEGILGRCSHQYDNQSEKHPIDLEEINAQTELLASHGLRVLAFAAKDMDQSVERIDHEDVADNLVFLGLQAMVDPPRPEAIEAVGHCRDAGIKVKMITGDHVVTAKAIAGELGFKEAEEDQAHMAINGVALAEVEDADYPQTADEKTVFARVTPEQKFKLVKALQEKGHIVAMTGDGVNDAPALKQADIGIAMGITGTEVSKEAADMVLTDDNFASIVSAVREGRGIYDNLIKFIVWTLPTNLSEGLVILIASFTNLSIPISPLQILWINMTTALLLGMMLAFEKKEPGIMSRDPRDTRAPIISGRIAFRILWLGLVLVCGVYIVYEIHILRGGTIAQAQTAATNMIVFGELFYLFNCRSLTLSPFKIGFFSNKWIWLGVGAMTGLQLLFSYTPLFGRIFHTEPFFNRAWLVILGISLFISLSVELEKYFLRRSERA
ncbi:MAG: cation-transporting P-type ATPase [Proteobacteria bacterium]|nr:cation-transporting P-type ATPase [Pseudomonadota bacterium]